MQRLHSFLKVQLYLNLLTNNLHNLAYAVTDPGLKLLNHLRASFSNFPGNNLHRRGSLFPCTISTLQNLLMWEIGSSVVCLYFGNSGCLKSFSCMSTSISTKSGKLPQFDCNKEFNLEWTRSFFDEASATSS